MSTETHQPPPWLHENVESGHLHLTPSKDVLGEPEGRELSEFLRHRLDGDGGVGITFVVVDLSKVGLITSPAIGALIVIHKRLATTNRQLVLSHLAPMLLETLVFLKLDKVFTICRTPEDMAKVLSSS